MSALTATLAKLVDDVEPTPGTEFVLESAPSAAKIDERSAPGLITEHEVVFNTTAYSSTVISNQPESVSSGRSTGGTKLPVLQAIIGTEISQREPFEFNPLVVGSTSPVAAERFH
jgi:hypothetical protein